jgi:hypothetical protein
VLAEYLRRYTET